MGLARIFSSRQADQVERGRKPRRSQEVAAPATVQAAMADEAASPGASPADSNTPESIDLEPDWPRGWRPYMTLAACFFLMFNSWGVVNAYGTFQAYYLGNLLDRSDSTRANLIGALQCFIVLALSNIMGVLLDARYNRQVLGTGTILVGAGMFATGPVSTRGYGAVLGTQGIVASLGMACFFVASSQIASTWFKKRKTIAVGIVACGASIAGLVFPFMLRYLIPTLGFERSVYCVSGVVLATSIFAWLFAVPRPLHAPHKAKVWSAWETWVDPHAWRNNAWRWATASVSWMFFGFYTVFFNLEEWAANQGVAAKTNLGGASGVTQASAAALSTSFLLAIMNVSSSTGRVGGGYMGQKYGAVFVHSVVMGVAAILCLVMWPFITNTAGAVAFCILFGAFSGAVIGMPPASIMWILQRDPNADEHRIGQWVGMMYTVAAVPALIGPVICGVLINATNDFLVLHLWSGLCLAVATICMVMAWYVGKSNDEKFKLWSDLSVSTMARRYSDYPSANSSSTNVSEIKRSSRSSSESKSAKDLEMGLGSDSNDDEKAAQPAAAERPTESGTQQAKRDAATST